MTSVPNHRPPSNGNNMKTLQKASLNRFSLWFIGLGIWLCFAQNAVGQNEPMSHGVYTTKPGDDLVSVMREFEMCQADFLALNPQAKQWIAVPGERSEFPSHISFIVNNTSTAKKFIQHKVGRKQTLFGIAKSYGLTVADLLADNPGVSSQDLKKGTRLNIVQNCSMLSTSDIASIRDALSHKLIVLHEVTSRENLFSIAHQYNMSLPELRALNPKLSDSVNPGQSIKVRGERLTTSEDNDDALDYYVVQAKEGFFRLRQKFGLTKEEVIQMNPSAESGLKLGMVLKLPKAVLGQNSVYEESVVDLRDFASDSSRQKITLMLPLQLDGFMPDSLTQNQDYLQRNRLLRIALDFYTGVLMARDYAASYGFPVTLDVVDTQAKTTSVDSLLGFYDFSETDAVIGPLLPNNVTRVARHTEELQVPVFSPLSRPSGSLPGNLVQTLPDQKPMGKAMMDYIQRNALEKKMLFLGDAQASGLVAMRGQWPEVPVLFPREQGYIDPDDILPHLSDSLENWVLLESRKPVIISNVIGVLNGMEYYQQKIMAEMDEEERDTIPKTYEVRLFTTNRNEAFDFDDISNIHLSHLEFSFPSASMPTSQGEEPQLFEFQYAERFGCPPNKYASRGFDLTLDIILRGAISEGPLIDQLVMPEATQYTENKFHYQARAEGGYENRAFYLLKYTQGMGLEPLVDQ